jgi:hypothetical protein
VSILNVRVGPHLNHIIALNIVIFHQFFYVDQIGCCLSRNGNLAVSQERLHLSLQIDDKLFSKSAIHKPVFMECSYQIINNELTIWFS